MAVTAELSPDYEFTCEMTEQEKALVAKIQEANKQGKTTFSDEEMTQEEAKLLGNLLVKDQKAFTEETAKGFKQYQQEVHDSYGEAKDSMKSDFEEFRNNMHKSMDEFRNQGGVTGFRNETREQPDSIEFQPAEKSSIEQGPSKTMTTEERIAMMRAQMNRSK